jgi:hypothetical protein
MKDEVQALLFLIGAGALFFAASKLFAKPRASALAQAQRVACLGDSLTAAANGYCSELGARLVVPTKAFGYQSQGTEVIGTHVEDVLAWVPDVVVVLAGVNDLPLANGAQRAVDGLYDIYKKLRAAGVAVVAVEILPWHGYKTAAGHEENTALVNEWIRWESKAAAFVRTSSMGDEQGRLLPAYSSGDGLHLSHEGHVELARLIAVQAFGR